MHCTRKITDDLYWVGGNDRRLPLFEGVYEVPDGVSYNAYLLLDDATVLFDTVEHAVSQVFFENLAYLLGKRPLDYLVVQHMEPDHSAEIAALLQHYPALTVVCNAKTQTMLRQFFGPAFAPQMRIVAEGDTLHTGRHELRFLFAPMVHWPEVMVSYDAASRTLFSADAFGTFGSLHGALFADEVDFAHSYLDEARRYYANIVGKYGTQVQALLKKAAGLEIDRICPLHGFVWRTELDFILEKYQKWSTYAPEEPGVLIAYASVYGHTANVADALACRLRERGVTTRVYDVSVTPAATVVAAAFRFSHLVFASTTYNNGIFVRMEDLLHDVVAHNLQNRTIALIQNGSWAPASGKLMRELLSGLKNTNILEQTLTLKSALEPAQEAELDALADAICATL